MRFIRKNIIIIFIIALVIVLSVLSFIKIKLKYQTKEIKTTPTNLLIENKNNNNNEEYIFVEIKGEVNKPNVYRTTTNQRVIDIINMSGGLTDNADTSITNLSKKIYDEMVIIIYSKEQVQNSNIKETVIKVVEKECVCPNIQNDSCLNTDIIEDITNNNENPNHLISLNNASLEELMSVSGIGESKAQAIIEYRELTPFKSVEELQNIDGIGSKTYEKIKIYFTT